MIHRTLTKGNWVICPDPETCDRPHHLDLTPQEAKALPLPLLLPLLEIMDPPIVVRSDGTKVWHISPSLPLEHREYDLPALVYPDGAMIWMSLNKAHRAWDRPALIRADGVQIWYRNGQRHRAYDRPAYTHPNGTKQWWERDKLLKVEKPDGEIRLY